MIKLKDIAEKAGLNVSTVSRALLDKPDISAETRRRVKKIAGELGYSPKHIKSNLIGVLVPEVTSQYYAELVHVMEKNLRAKGYTMICMLTGFNIKRIDSALESLCRQGVGGIILSEATFENDDGIPNEVLAKPGIPIVVQSEIRNVSPHDSIYIDQYKIITLAVDHLIGLGHTKIGYIGEDLSNIRYLAQIDLMKQKGLEIDPRFFKCGSERFEKGGYLRAQELLNEPELPTAVIASYDQMAVGAIKAFTEAGVKVPKNMSIVGVDNVIGNDYMFTRLTSITNPVEQLGIIAVKLLLDNISDPAGHVIQHVALQSKLVIRDSTAPPPQVKRTVNLNENHALRNRT